jgi:membrane fusion protein (multidrug efflux system)
MNILLRHKFGIGATLCAIAVGLIVLGGSKGKGTPTPASTPDVAVVQVEQKDVPIYGEWIGTLDGMVNAEIKAQVSGYLVRKNYTEGSYVKKGQLLFEIDSRPFQAAVDQAQGDLAKADGQLLQAEGQLARENSQLLQSQAQLTQAEANQGKTQIDVNRYTPLAKEKAITDEALDHAVQSNLEARANTKAAEAGVQTAKAAIVVARAAVEAAKATVQAARAAVRTAELNLSFTRITSLIDGVAGIAQAQVGNLVGPSSGTMTTVSTVDPIKVYFTISEQEYLQFARRGTPMNRLEFELILADGTIYTHKGRFAFADRQVSENTGAIQLTALFPNPANVLRPGQYGKARTVTDTIAGALLVPQGAVTELQGSFQVATVDSENTVSIETVKLGNRVGSMWVISDGLKPRERVIADGVQKVSPGMRVNPKPLREAMEAARGE